MHKFFLTFTALFIIKFAFGQFAYQQNIAGPDLTLHESHLVDWDHDSDLDIIACSEYFIVWWKNEGNGAFSTQQVLCNLNHFYRSFDTLDVDMDGDLDILTVADNGELYWYEHLPGEFLGEKNIIGTGLSEPKCIRTSDIDGDGDRDLTVTSKLANIIYWFENLGSGAFGVATVLSTEVVAPEEHHHYDLDDDGDLDILVTSFTSDELSWFANLGGGTFGTKQVICDTLDGLNECVAGDLDNDGDLDLASVSQIDQKVYWFQNDGSGIFSAPMEVFNAAAFSKSVILVDIDSDNYLDIVTCTLSMYSVVWFKNNGNGTFQSPAEIYATGPSWAASVSFNAADIDNDGDMDLMAASQGFKFGVFLNDGANNFELNMITNILAGGNGIHFYDINGDGEKDILTMETASLSEILYYVNYGNGVFSDPVTCPGPLTFYLSDVDACDIDNDGDLDIISCAGVGGAGSVYLHENNGDSIINYSEVNQLFFHFPKSIRPADLDGDGNIDLLIAAQNNDRVGWIRNQGAGVFDPPASISDLVEYAQFADAADFDGDGDLDIFASSSVDDQIVVFENLGGGNFGPEQEVTNQADGVSAGVRAVDLDGDDDLDLISASFFDDKIAWYENDGTGIFGTEQIISEGQDLTGGFDLADMDADGDMDLLLGPGNYDPGILWLENDGSANFVASYPASEQLFNSVGVYAQDIDHDSDLDIVVSAWPQNLYWLENKAIYKSAVKGRTFIDINQNFQLDSADVGFSYTPILSSPQSDYTFTLSQGYYSMILGGGSNGTYVIAPAPIDYWSIVTDSISYSVLIDSTYNSYDSLDFGFFPDTLIQELKVDLEGSSMQRCNLEIPMQITLHNTGTTILQDAVIHLVLDPTVSFLSSSITPDSILSNNVYWHIDSVFYFEYESINLTFLNPDASFMGTNLVHTVNVIGPDSSGTISYQATDSADAILSCAYDPNYKDVNLKGLGLEGSISPYTEELEYVVHFQNTGTATATDVLIKDALDSDLIWSSLTILSYSHPLQVSVNEFGEVSFFFEDIMLPDSNANFIASQGFVKHKIDVKNNLPHGTEIVNQAGIYFDLNSPIITNTVLNTIDYCLIAAEVEISVIDDIVCVSDLSHPILTSPSGGILSGNGMVNEEFDPSIAGFGTHTITYEYADLNGCVKYDSLLINVVDCLDLSEWETQLEIYPNPTSGTLFINGTISEIDNLFVYDLVGRLIPVVISIDDNTIQLVVDCDPGVYLLEVHFMSGKSTSLKFVKS